MIESLNDFVSIFVLLCIPVGFGGYFIHKLLKSRRLKRKVKEGKYYPEW